MFRSAVLGLLMVILVCLSACSSAPQPADLVLTGGVVFTADSAGTLAEAVAVRGNRIVAVGSDDEIAGLIEQGTTKIIDLGGAFVTPGFNDAHAHLVQVGEKLESVDLTGITSWDQMRAAVVERVARSKPGELILGMGWEQTIVGDGDWPTRAIIDPVSPQNPVILRRVDGHSALVNSYVLEHAGITRDTPDPNGGTIVRGADGEPTGILKENAVGLADRDSYEQDRDSPAVQERRLLLAMRRANSKGLTSVSTIGGNPRVLEKLAGENRLTLRISYSPALPSDTTAYNQYEKFQLEWEKYPLLRFGFLKSFIDGTLGSATAALFAPYADEPSTSGTLVQPVEELTRKVLDADRRGYQIGVHAIGTRANRIVLDAYQEAIVENGRRDSRHRIEHTQLLTEQDIPRFPSLGVIASMQPTHCITDKRFAESRLGLERCRYSYAWRSLLDAGAVVAFGSDAPVEPLDPLEGLYAAVTRKDRAGEAGPGWIPQEKLTMPEAITQYTAAPAYAEFQEHEKGRLTPGMLADMAVFERNLLTAAENEIMTSRLLYTIVDGRVVYENK